MILDPIRIGARIQERRHHRDVTRTRSHVQRVRTRFRRLTVDARARFE